MNKTELGFSLFQAVQDGTDPAAKMVYADWLEDRGEADVAFAYRWAARRRLHPRVTPERRFATWTAPTGSPRKNPPAHQLPRIVFEEIRPRSGSAKRFLSVALAFVALARALERFREALA